MNNFKSNNELKNAVEITAIVSLTTATVQAILLLRGVLCFQ